MPITYDRKAVYDAVRGPVFAGRLSASQVEGIDAILSEWERLQPVGDIRFAAYVCATPTWETAHTMQPIEEYGHGRGRAYGHPAGPWHQVYDGRGDVQLTWEANYRKATDRLRAKGVIGADVDLEKTPALAMRPDIAAAIMIYGMIEGWFTGRKLADYFHGLATDWIGARHIINGSDHAADIAAIAAHWFTALKSAAVYAQGAPAPAASKPEPALPPAPTPPLTPPPRGDGGHSPKIATPTPTPPAPTAPAPASSGLVAGMFSGIASLFGR